MKTTDPIVEAVAEDLKKTGKTSKSKTKKSKTKKETKSKVSKLDQAKPKNLKPEELNSALFLAQDYFGRAMVPFILIGETLEAIRKEHLEGNRIILAVKKNAMARHGKAVLKELIPDIKIGRKYVRFKLNKVPFKVVMVPDDKYSYFKNPNTINYLFSIFHVPNPYEEYALDKWWKKI